MLSQRLIESPDEPGSNLTGIGFPSEGYLKQFELLTELLPQARVIAVLINPNSKAAERQIQQVQEAARGMGIQVKILKANMDVDFETAFADLASANVAGLLVGADLFFDIWRERLVSLAARYAIPTIYGWREFAERGGLMSYGPSRAAIGAKLQCMPERSLRAQSQSICRSRSPGGLNWWLTRRPPGCSA